MVILAERDKVEMEDAIRDKVGDLGGTRVVCRTGSADRPRRPARSSTRTRRARSSCSRPTGEDPDAQVIKTVLALTRGPERRAEPYHIVAEIQDPANLEAARLVGGDEAVLVDKRETIARLIVQTSRQSGVSAVYTELLDFDGDEIYFRADPALAGETFGDALLAYEDCAVIGLAARRRRGRSSTRRPTRVVRARRQRDRDRRGRRDPRGRAIASSRRDRRGRDRRGSSAPPTAPQRVLVLGWNARTRTVIRELDKYVEPGSTMLSSSPTRERGGERARGRAARA